MLNVNNLHLQVSGTQLLQGLSFAINRGEILALAGESGCGKSLTAQAILQLFPKKQFYLQGEIFFESQNLLTLTEKQLRHIRGRKIAFVSQDPSSALNPTLKIGTQLIETLLLYNPGLKKSEATQQGVEWLEKMHMTNALLRMSQYPHELSGGMKQRVLLAMALIGKPSLLIADEPTTALDVTVQAEILTILKKLRAEENLSILLITHDLGVVAHCSDRLMIMQKGKIIESGPVDQVFTHPAHPYTKTLLHHAKRGLIN